MKYVLFTASFLLAASQASAQPQTNIAPHAQQVLAAACQYLAETPSSSLNAEVWREHVTESGQKLQFSRSISMDVKRPNRLHVEISSPHSQRGFWYDGKALTVLNRRDNLFSVAARRAPWMRPWTKRTINSALICPSSTWR